MMSALYYTNTLHWILIVLVYCDGLSFGKGDRSGALYAFPVTFAQLTHFRITHATFCLADGIQIFFLR